MNRLTQISLIGSIAAMIPFIYTLEFGMFLGQTAALLCGMFLRPYVQRHYCITFLSIPIIIDIIHLLKLYPSIMELYLTMILPLNINLGEQPQFFITIIFISIYVMSILVSYRLGIIVGKSFKLIGIVIR